MQRHVAHVEAAFEYRLNQLIYKNRKGFGIKPTV